MDGNDQPERTPWRPPQRVRPIAVAVVRQGADLLLMQVQRDDGTTAGWRPLGGEIELGETAADAVVRELWEELGARARVVERLGVLENLYTFEGVPGHEVVFVFAVELDEAGIAGDAAITYREGAMQVHAAWIPLAAFREARERLFPEALLGLL